MVNGFLVGLVVLCAFLRSDDASESTGRRRVSLNPGPDSSNGATRKSAEDSDPSLRNPSAAAGVLDSLPSFSRRKKKIEKKNDHQAGNWQDWRSQRWPPLGKMAAEKLTNPKWVASAASWSTAAANLCGRRWLAGDLLGHGVRCARQGSAPGHITTRPASGAGAGGRGRAAIGRRPGLGGRGHGRVHYEVRPCWVTFRPARRAAAARPPRPFLPLGPRFGSLSLSLSLSVCVSRSVLAAEKLCIGRQSWSADASRRTRHANPHTLRSRELRVLRPFRFAALPFRVSFFFREREREIPRDVFTELCAPLRI